MYAIVEIAGQQFKVEKDLEIFVHRLEAEEGSSVEFDNVMLVDNAGKVSIGMPNVSGIKIKAKVLEHMKADKVLVFHKKRRKGYQKQNGHRQYMSRILIEDILTGAKKAEKKTEAKVEAPKKEAKPKAEVKKEAKPKAEKKEVKPKAEKKEVKPKADATPKVKKETKPKVAPKAKKETDDKKED